MLEHFALRATLTAMEKGVDTKVIGILLLDDLNEEWFYCGWFFLPSIGMTRVVLLGSVTRRLFMKAAGAASITPS